MKTFFMKILSMFKKAWFISFTVLVVISLAIWFFVSVSVFVFLLIMVGLIFIWGVLNIVLQKLFDKKKYAEEKQSAAQEAGALPNKKFLKATLLNLTARFNKANNIVNTGSFNKSLFNRTNYQLPWYIVMGASGSGKTTLLKNSNVEIYQEYNNETNAKQGDEDPMCHWCFSKDAVFIDVDGAIFDDINPQSLNNQVWKKLILLLRKNRCKKPLSGVLLTIDIQKLLANSEEQRQLFAFQFRQRLKALNTLLGINCPVYCVFNKFDTIAGFNEYFDSIDSKERSQMWGVTFQYDEKDTMGFFINEFDDLLKSMKEKLIDRLQVNEWDQFRSGLINGFLLQMGQMRNVLRDFVKQVSQKNAYYDQTFLRGTYFLSACRAGIPADNIAEALNQELGLDHHPLPESTASNTSVFARNLLSNHMAAEKNNVTLSDYARKKLSIRRGFIFAVSALVIISLMGLWFNTVVRSKRLFYEAQEMVMQVTQVSEKPKYLGSLSKRMPILNMLSQIRYDLIQPNLEPFTNTWGLYNGGIVLDEFNAIYLSQLKMYLLPYLKQTLENNIKNNDSDNQYQLFNDLQTYLMLSMPEFSNQSFVKSWMYHYWKKAYPKNSLYRSSLYGNLVSLIQLNNNNSRVDVPLVNQARKALGVLGLSQLGFYNLLTSFGHNFDNAIKIQMMLNADFNAVFGSSSRHFNILKLYSQLGYKNLFQPNIKNSIDNLKQAWWVLGEHKPKYLSLIEKEKIKNGVILLYMDAYIAAWQNALGKLKVVPFNSITQADSVLQILAGDASPIKSILQIIAENTSLRPATSISYVKFNIDPKMEQQMLTPVQQSFAPLIAMTATPDTKKKPLATAAEKPKENKSPYIGLQKAFTQLYQYVHNLAQADDNGKSSYAFALQSLQPKSKSPLTVLNNMALGFPDPLKRWVQSISSNVWGGILIDAGDHLQNVWQHNVYPKYQAMIAAKYPVNSKAKQEITLNDFSAFFAPGGIFDQFFQTNVAPFVDQSGAHWTLKKISGHSLNIPVRVLRLFKQSEDIKKAFFEANSKQPLVNFMVTPTGLDGTSQEFRIMLNGQVVVYQHGPIQSLPMQWPKESPYPIATVCFVTINGQQVTKTVTGAWGWLKLIARLKLQRGASLGEVKVTAKFGGHLATFNLLSKGQINPFYPNLLTGYHLPKSIQ